MAINTSTESWNTLVGKRPTIRAIVNSRAQIFTIDVTVGVADKYTTNGLVVSLKGGKIKEYIAVIPVSNDKGLDLTYDVVNEKIIARGQLADDAAGTNTAASALKELDNDSVITYSMKASFLVIGR